MCGNQKFRNSKSKATSSITFEEEFKIVADFKGPALLTIEVFCQSSPNNSVILHKIIRENVGFGVKCRQTIELLSWSYKKSPAKLAFTIFEGKDALVLKFF